MRRKMTMVMAAMLAVGMLAAPAPASQPSITDIAVGDGKFDRNQNDTDILAAAVGAAGLAGVLDSDDVNFTVFAPTDRAFRLLTRDLGGPWKAHEADVAAWLVENVGVETLTNVLLYHVVDGEVFSSDVVPGLQGADVPTLLGSTFEVFIQFRGNGSLKAVFLRDQDHDDLNAKLKLNALDIDASNGVVHVIDRVMRPIDLP
jgi:uncharacterized surface protein with fasciclin (FAS1) repeats